MPSTTSTAGCKATGGHAYRGRKNDPRHPDRPALRRQNLTARRRVLLQRATVAVRPATPIRPPGALRADESPKILTAGPTCPIPEIRRLGETLQLCREVFLAYRETGGAGIKAAVNGFIELHRRVARSFRNRADQRLRILLAGGGRLTPTFK